MLDKLRNNDPTAFEELYEKNYPSIYRMVRINSGTSEDAQDLFQEALLSMLEKIRTPGFKLTSKISTYLFKVAKNTWLNKLRERKKDGPAKPLPKAISSDNEDIEEKLYNRQQVMLALEKLGEECRAILIAIYWHGEKPREMAKEMGLGGDYFRVKKFRCMQQLKNLLK